MGNLTVTSFNIKQRPSECNGGYGFWGSVQKCFSVFAQPFVDDYSFGMSDYFVKTLTPPPPVITEADKENSLGTPYFSKFEVDKCVKEVKLENGVKVNITKFTEFEGMQDEMLEVFRCMAQAAEELGITFTLSEVSRTVSTSNKANSSKPSLAAKGGESPHNYGAAVDICLFYDGKSVVTTSSIQKKFADRVIELSNGNVVWGGYFERDRNGKDRPGTGEEHHFEIKGWEEKYKKEENKIIKFKG